MIPLIELNDVLIGILHLFHGKDEIINILVVDPLVFGVQTLHLKNFKLFLVLLLKLGQLGVFFSIWRIGHILLHYFFELMAIFLFNGPNEV